MFFTCDSIDTELIVEDSDELEKIFKEAYNQEISLVQSKDDNQLARRIRDYGFDKMVIYRNRTYNNVNSDSLVFFIKLGPYTILPEKRIIYDFAKRARHFGNEKRQGYESYERIQVNDRWYFETVATVL